MDAIEIIMTSKTVGPTDVGTGHCVSIPRYKTRLIQKINTIGERIKTQANTKKLRDLGFVAKHTVAQFPKDRGIQE